MQTPAIHHLVTIRLEDHVEQLEHTHQALIGVRAHLSQIQRSLEHASRHIVVEAEVPEDLRMALHRLHATSDIIDALLKTIQRRTVGQLADLWT